MCEQNVREPGHRITAPANDLGPEELTWIAEIVAEARPGILADGGDIELAGVSGDVVRIRLTGACTHCAFAGHTLGGLRCQIVARLGRPLRVLPALSSAS